MPLLRISVGLIIFALASASTAYGASKTRTAKLKSSSLTYDASSQKRSKIRKSTTRKTLKKSRRIIKTTKSQSKRIKRSKSQGATRKSKITARRNNSKLTAASTSNITLKDPLNGKRLFIIGLFGTFITMGLLVISTLWRQQRRNEIIRKLIVQGADSHDFAREQDKPFKLNEPVKSFEGLPFSKHEHNADDTNITTDTLLGNSPYTPSPIASEMAEAAISDSDIEDQPAHTKEVAPLSVHSKVAPEKIEEGKVTVSSSFKEEKLDLDDSIEDIDQTVISSVPLQFSVLPDTKPREQDWNAVQSMIPDGSSSGKAS